MTLKIGLDVQFIKTETAAEGFRESRVETVCSEKSQEKGRLQFAELKKEIQRQGFEKLLRAVWLPVSKNNLREIKPEKCTVRKHFIVLDATTLNESSFK